MPNFDGVQPSAPELVQVNSIIRTPEFYAAVFNEKSVLSALVDRGSYLQLSDDDFREFLACLARHKASNHVFPEEALAVSGTGSKPVNSINTSSLASLLAACAGTKVVKTGTKSSRTSRLGAFDIFEKLGFKSEDRTVSVDYLTHNIAFLSSDSTYPWLGYLPLVQRYLKSDERYHSLIHEMDREEYNCVRRLIGACTLDVERFAYSCPRKPHEYLAVCAGEFGEGIILDEGSVCGITTILSRSDGAQYCMRLTPEDFGLRSYPLSDILIQNKDEALQCLNDLIQGRSVRPAWRDLIILNAAIVRCVGQRDLAGLKAEATRLRGVFEASFSTYLRNVMMEHLSDTYRMG